LHSLLFSVKITLSPAPKAEKVLFKLEGEVVSFWRDVSLIVLAAEAIALGIPIAIALYYAVKGVLWLRTNASPIMATLQREVLRVERITEMTCRAIVFPFIQLQVAATRVCATMRALCRR